MLLLYLLIDILAGNLQDKSLLCHPECFEGDKGEQALILRSAYRVMEILLTRCPKFFRVLCHSYFFFSFLPKIEKCT